MLDFENAKEQIKNFIENQKHNINSAIILILIVDALFAIFFTLDFQATGMCRNLLIMDSKMHSCTTLQFVKSGWLWLSFMDLFVFAPVIAWAMYMPTLVRQANEADVKESERNE